MAFLTVQRERASHPSGGAVSRPTTSADPLWAGGYVGIARPAGGFARKREVTMKVRQLFRTSNRQCAGQTFTPLALGGLENRTVLSHMAFTPFGEHGPVLPALASFLGASNQNAVADGRAECGDDPEQSQHQLSAGNLSAATRATSMPRSSLPSAFRDPVLCRRRPATGGAGPRQTLQNITSSLAVFALHWTWTTSCPFRPAARFLARSRATPAPWPAA